MKREEKRGVKYLIIIYAGQKPRLHSNIVGFELAIAFMFLFRTIQMLCILYVALPLYYQAYKIYKSYCHNPSQITQAFSLKIVHNLTVFPGVAREFFYAHYNI